MSYATTHEHLRAELDRIETIIETHGGTETLGEAVDSVPTKHDEPPEPSTLSLTVADDDRETIREHAETIQR